MSMPPQLRPHRGHARKPLWFAGRGTVADCASGHPAPSRRGSSASAASNGSGHLKAATWLRPAYALARITALTVSKIWSMWLRSQINGGENSNVSIAMRTIRPRS